MGQRLKKNSRLSDFVASAHALALARVLAHAYALALARVLASLFQLSYGF